MSTPTMGEPGTAAGSPTTLTAAAEALHASRHMEPELCVRDGERCGLLSDLAAIEQEARADAEAEVTRLRALAAGWVAYLHGYASTNTDPSVPYQHRGDWTKCPWHPCRQAAAALAPAATPAPPAPGERRTHDAVKVDVATIGYDTARTIHTRLRELHPRSHPRASGGPCAECIETGRQACEMAFYTLRELGYVITRDDDLQPDPAPGERCRCGGTLDEASVLSPDHQPDLSVGAMTDDEWQEFSDAITPEGGS